MTSRAAPAKARPDTLPPTAGGAIAPTPGDRGRYERRATVLGATAAAVIAWLHTFLIYRVWDMRWDVPLYEQFTDARAVAANVKGVLEYGWWLTNDGLNAPFGQDEHDFPGSGESLQFLAFKVLGYVVPSTAHVMNLYFLAGFGVIAAVAFLVMRRLRFSWQVSLVVALAYAFLPFHFWHEQDHLTRSSYFYGPVACLVMLWALTWRTTLLRDPNGGLRHNLRPGRVAALAAMAVLVAVSETMTTAFTMTMLVVSAFVAAIRWRDVRHLLVGGVLAALMMAAFLAVSAPTLIYWAQHGPNEVALNRGVAESELYGLKLTWLVLPEPGHRVEFLDRLGARAREGTPIGSEPGQALGLLGAFGFLAGLVAILLHGLRSRDGRSREGLFDNAALLLVVAVLFSVVGGFSIVMAVIGFDHVRVWNRIVILIAFLSLLVTAIMLEHGLERLRRRWRGRVATLAMAPLLLLPVALLDGPPPFPEGSIFATLGDRDEAELRWVVDERFVNEIEEQMPDEAMIFQFPVIPFPEGGAVGTMRAYDQLRPYVHDDGSLRWSTGGVKGRPESDWQQRVGEPVEALPALLGMGFTGLWIDGHGYGEDIDALDAALVDEIGDQPTVSGDGRWRFWDLRDYRATLERSDAELRELAERRFGIAPPGS